MNDDDEATTPPEPFLENGDGTVSDDLLGSVDGAHNLFGAGPHGSEGVHSGPVRPWEKARGVIQRGNKTIIGKVGAPPQQEATSSKFYFWVPPEALVEQTQLVTSESKIAGTDLTFYAIVDEVYRRSRQNSMGGEFDEADGDLEYDPPFLSDGYTYAEASILRVVPPALTPPRERSEVYLAREEDAGRAYFRDEIDGPNQLPVGLAKNGGDRTAGAGAIDLDYLLGENGGHMLVTGTSGRGSKSSFLLFVISMLLR
ncbi:MAG TPA: hypothetical protein VGW38_11945 [Chloroflexota bacterium]|nr:hypothetical protein [Chloroflexota bacterium]